MGCGNPQKIDTGRDRESLHRQHGGLLKLVVRPKIPVRYAAQRRRMRQAKPCAQQRVRQIAVLGYAAPSIRTAGPRVTVHEIDAALAQTKRLQAQATIVNCRPSVL
jgi:hypothetical protein